MLEAIDSVYTQSLTGHNVETIVVDDGSTDDTCKQVSDNFNNVIYMHQNNSGVSVARNAGIMKASGDYIAFLDSDDKWTENKLEFQLSTMLSTNCDICYADWNEIEDLRR